MRDTIRYTPTFATRLTAAALCSALTLPSAAFAQQATTPAPANVQAQYNQAAQPPTTTEQISQRAGSEGYTMKINSNIVLTNVVVRDKQGNVVKGLKASDFSIVEDKTPQKIVSFDYENIDNAALLNEKSTTSGHASIADLLEGNFAATPAQLKDHRLIVMFFDFSTMQDDDTDRAVDAATKYVNEQMQPADLVAMVSMSTGLSLDQDFTSDKSALLSVLKKYNGDDDSAGFALGGDGTTDGTSDDASSFTADDSEFNSLNTDRELYAIRSIAKSLERVDQRKSMLYFSGGLSRQGIENQASLRSATNEAAKANLAIYSVDARGLQALPPVGNASKGSLRGTSAYTGGAVASQFKSNFSSQETLSTLSVDTGGKAFFDSNDFGPAFQQVQHDTEAYYILGFRSTNNMHDGAYRHLTVKANNKDYKLEYRPGYYAPADFQHQKTDDRNLALTEQMRSDLPATDVPVYLQAFYFRAADNKFFIPVSILIPGSTIPFAQKGNNDKATIDIIGQIKGTNDVDFGNVRDTLKLAVDQSKNVSHKNIQYSTAFTLAPGHYHLKFVVRENQTGKMGSFETDINVPDFKKVPLKLSSIVLATQLTPASSKSTSLLVRDGEEWVPNIAHIVRQDQHLYFLYEVYDPTKPKDATPAAATPGMVNRQGAPAHILTSIEFLQNGAKVYETPLVTADQVNIPARNALAFQFDVPASELKPGTYICQINVVDDAGGNFSFPRMAVRVQQALPAAPATAPAEVPPAAGGN
jgi:VWFA-related protein